MLSNINADKHQFLQIILVGQPQLKDMLRTPRLLQFAQRVSSDFHLRPLNPVEVEHYINYRLSAVGSRYQLFSKEACAAIADASRGIPRTINILCDTALVYGFAAELQQIGPDIVKQVIENKAQFGVLPLTASTGLDSTSKTAMTAEEIIGCLFYFARRVFSLGNHDPAPQRAPI